MRKFAKRDANHKAIVAAFRACGASIQDLADVGNGCPDLLIGICGENMPVEIKDGTKPPSAQVLTSDEERWHMQWRGTVITVYSAMQAVELCNKLRLRRGNNDKTNVS